MLPRVRSLAKNIGLKFCQEVKVLPKIDIGFAKRDKFNQKGI